MGFALRADDLLAVNAEDGDVAKAVNAPDPRSTRAAATPTASARRRPRLQHLTLYIALEA
jgi:hypothetical protein